MDSIALARERYRAITDLFAHEVDAVLQNPKGRCVEIVKAVRNKVFQVGTGQQALDVYEDGWALLRTMVRERQERVREIASLSQFGVVDDASEPLRPLLEGKLRSPETAFAVLEQLTHIVTKNLTLHGDIRIPYPAGTAEAFLSGVAIDGVALYNQADNPIAGYLQSLDVDLSELDPNGTRRQLYELVEFRQKLRVLDGQMRVPWEVLRQTNSELIPSWQIQRACRAHRAPTSRAKGSDINDLYLACTAPYCDTTFVDKRTFESFRRAKKRSPTIQLLAKSVRKAASYQHAIESVLEQ